ncbi:MAG: TFIIB-type zinc ribbon-containing protein [Candidatus Nanoarchaeia archaeon]
MGEEKKKKIEKISKIKKRDYKTQSKKQKDSLICPSCGSSKFAVDNASNERFCAKCGLVME